MSGGQSGAATIGLFSFSPSDLLAGDNGTSGHPLSLTADSLIIGAKQAQFSTSPAEVEVINIPLLSPAQLNPAGSYRVTYNIRERRQNPPGNQDTNDTLIMLRAGPAGLALINSDENDFNGNYAPDFNAYFGCTYIGNQCSRSGQGLPTGIANQAAYSAVFAFGPVSSSIAMYDGFDGTGTGVVHTLPGFTLPAGAQGLALSLGANHPHESYEILGIEVRIEQLSGTLFTDELSVPAGGSVLGLMLIGLAGLRDPAQRTKSAALTSS